MYVGDADEKFEVVLNCEATIGLNEKISGDSNYVNNCHNRVTGSYNIQRLQNSLSSKCDDLIQFQRKIVEQIEFLIGKLSKKTMEE